MKNWIETTNPPGIWVWSSDGGGWKWYPPVETVIPVEKSTILDEILDRKIDDFMRGAGFKDV